MMPNLQPLVCRLGWLAAQAAMLLGAGGTALCVAAGASRAAAAAQANGWEPLLNGGADEEQGGAEMGKRMQLVYGVLKYVWPDTWGLQIRCVGPC